MGPIAFLLVFLALPLATAVFLITYTAATLAWRGMAGAPLAAWALLASAIGAVAGLLIGCRLSRTRDA